VITNAAGTAKSVEQAQAVLDSASLFVVLGSYTMAERSGNPGVVDFFGAAYSLNVQGIPSPPAKQWALIVREVARRADDAGKRVVVNVAAFDPREYGRLAEIAFDAHADIVECNFGCPNMQDGGGFAPIISYRPTMVAEALASVRDAVGDGAEVWAKVSPVFDGALFAELAEALRPATGVVATNTVPQCLTLGPDGQPVLNFGVGVGGMAGRAIKPIALAQAARYVREGFRVIGVGGIVNGSDVHDYLAVGVESCQANSILQTEGVSALDRIVKEAESSAF
jgi:dihydroorotate dehydrogenase